MSRNSKQVLLDKPALAVCYESAHKQILGKRCFIRENEYGKFETFMDDLRDLGIGCHDYAYVVVTLLEKWLETKGFYRVPTNVFCGDWALKKYQAIDASDYVSVKDPDEEKNFEILQSELLVARTYVESNIKDVKRMQDIVKELRPLLSKLWIELPKEDRPAGEVVEMLCKEYGIGLVKDYNAIIRRLQCRQQ